MIPNPKLKLHFVNVNHGDCTIIEFPDYPPQSPVAHFAVVDFGAKKVVDRGLARDYMREMVQLRRANDANFRYAIEFACVTYPHDDHFGGLTRFFDEFADPANPDNNRIKAFWDCGFRTNSTVYNRNLARVPSRAGQSAGHPANRPKSLRAGPRRSDVWGVASPAATR